MYECQPVLFHGSAWSAGAVTRFGFQHRQPYIHCYVQFAKRSGAGQALGFGAIKVRGHGQQVGNGAFADQCKAEINRLPPYCLKAGRRFAGVGFVDIGLEYRQPFPGRQGAAPAGTPDTPETRTGSKCSPKTRQPAVYWRCWRPAIALFLTVLPMPEPPVLKYPSLPATTAVRVSDPTSTHQAGANNSLRRNPHPNRRKTLLCLAGAQHPRPQRSMLPRPIAQPQRLSADSARHLKSAGAPPPFPYCHQGPVTACSAPAVSVHSPGGRYRNCVHWRSANCFAASAGIVRLKGK